MVKEVLVSRAQTEKGNDSVVMISI